MSFARRPTLTPAKYPLLAASWKRFSLRALLGAVTVLAVVLGLVVQRGNRQRLAAERVHVASGYYGYAATPRPAAPNWLVRLLGKDAFYDIEEVELFDDDALAILRELPRVRALMLSGNLVTDQGLEQLPPCTRLERLRVWSDNVTDQSVPTLCQMQYLKLLDVSYAKISPAGFARLQRALPECQILGGLQPPRGTFALGR